MVYQAGRIAEHHSGNGSDGFWTFEAVRERLVEAMLLWMRSPGGGKWPFAGDGPWQLITRSVRATAGDVSDFELWRMEQDERKLGGGERPLPLTRAEVAVRDETSEWLRFVPERDRALVVLALTSLARGDKRVPWMRLKARMGVQWGAEGLKMRYRRSIAAIAKALNG